MEIRWLVDFQNQRWWHDLHWKHLKSEGFGSYKWWQIIQYHVPDTKKWYANSVNNFLPSDSLIFQKWRVLGWYRFRDTSNNTNSEVWCILQYWQNRNSNIDTTYYIMDIYIDISSFLIQNSNTIWKRWVNIFQLILSFL